MGLRNYTAGEALAPIVVVALAAGQVQLAFALAEQFFAQIEKRTRLGTGVYRDRQAARLTGDECSQREQFLALPGERLRSLILAAAAVDPLLEIERAGECRTERRVAGRDTLHALSPVAMAVGAGAAGGSDPLGPQLFALQHPQHPRVCGIFVLHRADVGAGEVVAGAPLVGCDLGRQRCGGGQAEHCREQGLTSTMIRLLSV